MKNKFFKLTLSICLFCLISYLYKAQGQRFINGHFEPNQTGYKPHDGFVPTSTVAIEIADAVLEPIYGEDQIYAEKPLVAHLDSSGKVWTVHGTLPKTSIGGTVLVKIQKEDGKVIFMSHSL